MRGVLRASVQKYELPPSAYPLLRLIQQQPGTTVSEIARHMGAAKSHISNMVEQLVQQHYVNKTSDPTDQRLVRLQLTDMASKRLQAMEDRSQAAWTLVFGQLPPGELEHLHRLLHTLHDALKNANLHIESQETMLQAIAEHRLHADTTASNVATDFSSQHGRGES